MRKRHGAGDERNRTLCGFECSTQEYLSMRLRREHQINCAHCLAKMGLKERTYGGKIIIGQKTNHA